jgi:hypothetical protein
MCDFGRFGFDAALPGKWNLKEAVGVLFSSKMSSKNVFLDTLPPIMKAMCLF